MKKIFLLIFIFTIVIANAQNWVQFGNTIESSQSSSSFATKMAINSAGTRYIQGAYRDDYNGVDQTGMASVYEYNLGNWTQLGSDLFGNEDAEWYGTSVDINNIGDIIAIGAPQKSGQPWQQEFDTGFVNIFQYDGTDWIQLGDTIKGNSSSNGFGTALSLNADGTTIAITAPYNDDNAANAGLLQVYSYDGTNWIQKGQNIYGLTSNDKFGQSVDLSDDGQRLIVGCPIDYDYGYVQIFDFDGTNWVLQKTINASQSYDGIGETVRINNAGDIISIGHPSYNDNGQTTNGGAVYTYKFNGSDWLLQGNPILGEENATFGRIFDMDSLGNTIVIGSDYYNNYAGRIQVFEFDGSDWVMLGDTIKGTVENDILGSSVCISSDASIIIDGELPSNNNSLLGEIKSFYYTCNSYSYTTIQKCESYTFNGVTYTESIILNDTIVNSFGCDSLITTNIIIDTLSTDFIISGNHMAAVQQYADTFEWINCETNDYTNINNNNSFATNVSSSGIYSLIITNGACKDTSDCRTVCITTYTTITDTSCFSYNFNGETVTQSGSYTDSLLGLYGCDSLVHYVLTITNVDSTVLVSADTLISNQAGADYQWVDCDAGNIYISGATDSIFIPEQSGNYAVILTYNSCVDTSNCNTITITNISKNLDNSFIDIYPNPAHNQLTINNAELSVKNIEIMDITGKTVKQFSVNNKTVSVDISDLKNGIYFLKLQGINISQTLKLIKK